MQFGFLEREFITENYNIVLYKQTNILHDDCSAKKDVYRENDMYFTFPANKTGF